MYKSKFSQICKIYSSGAFVAKAVYLQQRWLFGSGNSIICTKGCLFVAKMAFWFREFSHLQQRVFICSKKGFLVQGISIICSKGCLFVAKMAFWFREFYHLQQRMFMYNEEGFLVQGILSFVAKGIYLQQRRLFDSGNSIICSKGC